MALPPPGLTDLNLGSQQDRCPPVRNSAACDYRHFTGIQRGMNITQHAR